MVEPVIGEQRIVSNIVGDTVHPVAVSAFEQQVHEEKDEKYDARPASVRSTDDVRTTVEQGGTLASNHIFQDEKLAEYWRQVYDRAQYENRHRFDPSFEWTAEEEKRLTRRLDTRIMLWVWVMFMSLDLIRRNINRAVADNMLSDLNMNQNDFNNGQTIYYLTFLAMELPSGLISKKVGADVWVPTQIVTWSVINAAQAALKGRAGFFAVRGLLGAAQGGFIPDMCLYLSYFYTSDELNVRLSWFYTVLGFSQILGSLLAAGFLKLRGLRGLAGWQYLFAFESLICGVVGIIAFFLMPPSPTKTAGILRGRNGWFTEREEKILVNRILRDDPTKGDMNNRQGVDAVGMWKALKDKHNWPIYLLGLIIYIPYQPPQTYLSLILKQLGFSTLQSNMLAIPSQALFAFNCLWMTWLSTRFKDRGLIASIANLWTLPFLIGLYCVKESEGREYGWIRFALITCIVGFPYCHPFVIGWVSQNSHSVRTRTVSTCVYNMSYQVGSIIATQIYTDGDKPYYKRGTAALIGISTFAIVQCWLTKYYYILLNRRKEGRWEKMSHDERIHYATTTKEEGTTRLDTRFVH